MTFSGRSELAIKAAGIGAALLFSVAAGQAQSSGPFAGFDGAWTGTGTVALSDGSTERIRCKADYKVAGTGLNLKQALHCASDSYKFDLTSDVTSQGERISGNWSESNRNIFGNLQGTAGGGQIDVFVEANGFAANLSLRTNGSKQTVQISSKGEIRGVNITMTKGGSPFAIDREYAPGSREPGAFCWHGSARGSRLARDAFASASEIDRIRVTAPGVPAGERGLDVGFGRERLAQ